MGTTYIRIYATCELSEPLVVVSSRRCAIPAGTKSRGQRFPEQVQCRTCCISGGGDLASDARFGGAGTIGTVVIAVPQRGVGKMRRAVFSNAGRGRQNNNSRLVLGLLGIHSRRASTGPNLLYERRPMNWSAVKREEALGVFFRNNLRGPAVLFAASCSPGASRRFARV